MTESVRAFFALPATAAAHELLLDLQAKVLARAPGGRDAPRATRPDQLHLTLRFLGEIGPGPLEYLKSVLDKAAAKTRPAPIWVERLGAYPSPTRARVVVAELGDPDGRLRELAAALERAAVAVGLAAERRPFRPHITLCRLRQPAPVADWLGVDVPAGQVSGCDRLVLYRSTLRPAGPTYSVLAECALGETIS